MESIKSGMLEFFTSSYRAMILVLIFSGMFIFLMISGGSTTSKESIMELLSCLKMASS